MRRCLVCVAERPWLRLNSAQTGALALVGTFDQCLRAKPEPVHEAGLLDVTQTGGVMERLPPIGFSWFEMDVAPAM